MNIALAISIISRCVLEKDHSLMTRHVLIFIGCFVVGAVVTTIIRTSRHQPYAQPAIAQDMNK